MSKISIPKLLDMKAKGEKFAVLTAYEATLARQADQAGIEVLLVGDSLGNVIQGQDSTLPVTVADMAYHTACTKRGTSQALIIADLPFGSYNTLDDTLSNATKLMQAGAQMVKLEGGQWLCESISRLVECGIPVCAHLGLTPQSVHVLGGYRVQGKTEEDAQRIIEDAKAVEAAGASLLVMECIPSSLGKRISEALSIPVIGIGAGPDTDAQVLVVHDMLGIAQRLPKFSRNFLSDQTGIPEALSAYHQAVKDGSFPAPEHCFD